MNVETMATFQVWAREQIDLLESSICTEASEELAFQTSMVNLMTEDAIRDSTPKVNDFLDIMDPENVDGYTDVDYHEMVLRPAFIQEIILGRLVIKEPQKPITELPGFCMDQTKMEEFDTAADSLAT